MPRMVAWISWLALVVALLALTCLGIFVQRLRELSRIVFRLAEEAGLLNRRTGRFDG